MYRRVAYAPFEDDCATATSYYTASILDESREKIRWGARAHLKYHGIRPCSREVVPTEIFVTERVHLANLVAFELARMARPATQAVKLEHGTEHLAHNLRRNSNSKGAGNSVPGQVAVLGLTIDVDGPWLGEHVGLL